MCARIVSEAAAAEMKELSLKALTLLLRAAGPLGAPLPPLLLLLLLGPLPILRRFGYGVIGDDVALMRLSNACFFACCSQPFPFWGFACVTVITHPSFSFAGLSASFCFLPQHLNLLCMH